ncbi:ACT domain-containing protein [Sporomusa sphaeroides]|uniref:ACT domain-containing protein n=1 Tax=Sporomusa sphaeroides TaxID=47679 RepID=UPI002BEA41EF|nr:ACT domain-containing protein [Sporomusa sphaeroides]HML33993.1 ACT domain-containing protein [Sporomusa sphaeroides]
MTEKLKFEVLVDTLGVCRLCASQSIPQWAYQDEFFSITKTTEELSIVCSEVVIPEDVVCERGWRALKIAGILDFSLVGILSVVATILAKAGISIFAVSTYNTDYILVKAKDLECALQALEHKGYDVVIQ